MDYIGQVKILAFLRNNLIFVKTIFFIELWLGEVKKICYMSFVSIFCKILPILVIDEKLHFPLFSLILTEYSSFFVIN